MSYLSIFHTIFVENNDLSIYHYLAFESLFNLNIDKLYIHYYNIPTGTLWNTILNKYESKISLIYIHIPIKIFFVYKKSIIFKFLYDYGGIYFDEKILFLNNFNINDFNINNIYSTFDFTIIVSSNNNYLTYKLFKYFLQNNSNKFIDNNLDIHIINLNYDNNPDNLNYIINTEINDYTFSQYFHIFNNCSFFCYNNIIDISINKNITIFNLLIRSIFSKKYIDNIINRNIIDDKLLKMMFIVCILLLAYYFYNMTCNKRR
jgi:hypothetical protein